MKGYIFVNPYLIPKESILEAECLKKEFNDLKVDIDIVSDGFINCGVENNRNTMPYKGDFGVFLDKDKYLSKQLELGGLRLFNSHRAIRLCDDKAQTYLALLNKNVNVIDSVFGGLCYNSSVPLNINIFNKLKERFSLPFIAKECFGSMGKGVYKIENEEDFNEVFNTIKAKPHLFQRYIGNRVGTDVRVIVIGGKVLSAIERHNDNDFRSNVALGGKCTKISLSKEFIETAENSAKILGLDYCGIDILYGENNKPYVCEVNSNAFFFGFMQATKINVARKYAEYIIESVKNGK